VVLVLLVLVLLVLVLLVTDDEAGAATQVFTLEFYKYLIIID